MKHINTLIEDIDTLILSGTDAPSQTVLDAFGKRVASIISQRLQAPTKDKVIGLRLSNLGKSDTQLWYEMHGYGKDEELGAATLLKFMYGDVIEELLLTLAELAGHTVTDRQKEVEIGGVKGHIDALVDGEVVDVKSASSQSFSRFQDGSLKNNDSFGYYTQLSGYATALNKETAYFLCMDKTLGYTCTLQIPPEEIVDVPSRIKYLRTMLANTTPPTCSCTKKVEPNGNEYLTAPCSYNPYKHHIHPEIRTFIYSTGPRFFTKVVKEPQVPELKLSKAAIHGAERDASHG